MTSESPDEMDASHRMAYEIGRQEVENRWKKRQQADQGLVHAILGVSPMTVELLAKWMASHST